MILPEYRYSSLLVKKKYVFGFFVYYEEIKRELQKILVHVCRCNEILKVKSEGSTLLTYTGFRGGLEVLKIETRCVEMG